MSNIDSTPSAPDEKPPKRGGLLPILCLLIGLGVGFGLIFVDPLSLRPIAEDPSSALAEDASHSDATAPMSRLGDSVFVEIPSVVVALGPEAPEPYLRFSATLDVAQGQAAEVGLLLPRISDVLVTYLRAVRPTELQDPSAVYRLRAQMVRRIELVLGPQTVRDLLITEFILG